MPGTAAENRARLRAKTSKSAKRGGMRRPIKKKRTNVTATKERALMQVVRKQNMRAMDVDSVTMIKEDDSVVAFKNPKFLLNTKGGAFVVQGKSETKSAEESMSHLLGLGGFGGAGGGPGLSPEDLEKLKSMIAQAQAGGAGSGLGAGVDSFETGDDEDDEDDDEDDEEGSGEADE